MKKLFFILFVLPFFGKAQVYKAGDNFNFYNDIVPDTLLNYSPPSGNSSESYYLDINGDLVNDLYIQAYSNNGLGSGSDYITINFNSNTFGRFGRLDSVYHSWSWQFWWVTKIAQPLLFGDTINSPLAIWDNTSLTLTDDSYNTGAYKNVFDWLGPTDKYIGLKYQNTTDTMYGWIRVNCPNMGVYNYQCYIKDYSFHSTSIGIMEYNHKNIKIYPNPASEQLFIKNPSNIETLKLSIYTIEGKEIPLKQIITDEIDVSILPEGLYFLQLQTNEGVLRKKIVIHR